MKAYLAIAILALINTEQAEVNAVKLNHQAEFVDDIVKALAEADKAEDKQQPEKKEAPKAAPKQADKKKDDKKKEDKKAVDDEVPMDNAAIKAYSSVIADAAEDSEPANPVEYHEIKDEARSDQRLSHAPM